LKRITRIHDAVVFLCPIPTGYNNRGAKLLKILQASKKDDIIRMEGFRFEYEINKRTVWNISVEVKELRVTLFYRW